MMTEAEAKTKWCPFARLSPFSSERGYQPAANRWAGEAFSETPAHVNCLGSACMAWRWKEPPGPQHDPSGDSRLSGFCGLAVRP